MNQLEITQIKTEREKSENQQIKYTHTQKIRTEYSKAMWQYHIVQHNVTEILEWKERQG